MLPVNSLVGRLVGDDNSHPKCRVSDPTYIVKIPLQPAPSTWFEYLVQKRPSVDVPFKGWGSIHNLRMVFGN